MATTPERCGTFSVTSGCLCFGELHNILLGSSAPVQRFSNPRPHCAGTVKVHRIDFNVPAQQGRWDVFRLVNIDTGLVTGWFLSHSDVDSSLEIARILRVSGSPYEPDCGSNENDERTSAEGVFVINRYDWGCYDDRCRDMVDEPHREATGESAATVDAEDEGVDFAPSESIGIVDYAHAKDQVMTWGAQSPNRRDVSDGAVWMEIPHAEYKFGRWGFNNERTAAHSFVFFSSSTDFTRTTFAGQVRPLRKPETHEERFERRIAEGFDFSGLELLQRMSAAPDDPSVMSFELSPPLEYACLGPYRPREYVLRVQELDALRINPFRPNFSPELVDALESQGVSISNGLDRDWHALVFVEPWKARVCGLINQLVLSYLERFVLPRVPLSTPSMTANALFPGGTNPTPGKLLDLYCHCCFSQPHTGTIPNLDSLSVTGGIKRFLECRARSQPVAVEEDSITGIYRVITFLISEVLELASGVAVESHRYGIVPADIRISIYNDPELFNVFQYSTVFWKGGEED
ncbi:hypothetical protein BBP40_000444 [Aspergillus hancockii]|nr:hypothetical protein BBP40_000444 [Aspergillus hancockii]